MWQPDILTFYIKIIKLFSVSMFVHGKTIYQEILLKLFKMKWRHSPSPNRWHRDNKEDEDGDREVKEERVERGEGKEMVVKLKNRFPRGSLLTEIAMISQFFVSAFWNTPKISFFS